MLIIRPAQEKDLEAIYNLATKTGLGMTSLPADREMLNATIISSVNSFNTEVKIPGKEIYLFIAEDSKTGELLGVSKIKAKVGIDEPSYSYAIKDAVHKSDSLKVNKRIPYLQLDKEFDGPSLIGSLFVDPDKRGGNTGRALSLSRFLFIKNRREAFQDEMIAEMRGVITNGISPFWEGTIKPFFEMEFKDADYLSTQDKSFIADLMPKHPIYISLLDKQVQDCIAEVHPATRPALDFLVKQGFKKDSHVDIFDAGPRVKAPTDLISAIKDSQAKTITEIIPEEEFKELLDTTNSQAKLLSNLESGLDFRLVLARSINTAEGIAISDVAAQSLLIKEGQKVNIL